MEELVDEEITWLISYLRKTTVWKHVYHFDITWNLMTHFYLITLKNKNI